MRWSDQRRWDRPCRVLFSLILILFSFLSNGCASFQKPLSQMNRDEQNEAYQDQRSLWGFLSGGHLAREP